MNRINSQDTQSWLALVIGNSRLHWGWFEGATLTERWDTAHLSAEAVDRLLQHQFDFSQCHPRVKFSIDRPPDVPLLLWIASVVPAQTRLWQSYSGTRVLSLDRVPLTGLYPTMGIDRALALWGAASLGLPALVIDAGTALTFSGADAMGQFVGGAILPGLSLQLRSLTEHTAALPSLSDRLQALRSSASALPRWAGNTPDAMISGVFYTLLAGIDQFIQSWTATYPGSKIIFTGGDGDLLCHYWQQQYPQGSWQVRVDPNLVFWGMQSVIVGESLLEV